MKKITLAIALAFTTPAFADPVSITYDLVGTAVEDHGLTFTFPVTGNLTYYPTLGTVDVTVNAYYRFNGGSINPPEATMLFANLGSSGLSFDTTTLTGRGYANFVSTTTQGPCGPGFPISGGYFYSCSYSYALTGTVHGVPGPEMGTGLPAFLGALILPWFLRRRRPR